MVSTKWLANPSHGCRHIASKDHMYILFIIKVKILVFIKVVKKVPLFMLIVEPINVLIV